MIWIVLLRIQPLKLVSQKHKRRKCNQNFASLDTTSFSPKGIIFLTVKKKKPKNTIFQMKKKNQEIVFLFFTEFAILLRVHGGGNLKNDFKNKPNKTIKKDL